MEETIFFKVLEYGEKAGFEGISENEFWEWAKTQGADKLSSDPDDILKCSSLYKIFQTCFEQSSVKKDNETVSKYLLKTEYYFRLMEHRELVQSRLAAGSANRNAFFAIAISIFAIIVCAVLTFVSQRAPASISPSVQKVQISQDQLSGIMERLKSLETREVKLDKLQLMQIITALQSQKTVPPKRKSMAPASNEMEHYERINQYFEENQ